MRSLLRRTGGAGGLPRGLGIPDTPVEAGAAVAVVEAAAPLLLLLLLLGCLRPGLVVVVVVEMLVCLRLTPELERV